MVYIHIPEALTEEEQMLMAKYSKLKKKVVKLERSTINIIQFKYSFIEKAIASIENKT